jgi:hypothetical protein
MIILINRVTGFSEDDFTATVEMVDPDDIKYVRRWHLKGTLQEKYPDGFSLIQLKNEDKFKVSQSVEVLNQRINGIKDVETSN